tara:strand:- start:895 stop:3873 length:2979 start_codon:yes stop_codon:yes gene_type:complete
MPIMQYPYTENAVVTITTTYTGADPATIAGFITTPLENSIAQANGIDYMTSKSTQGVSTITVNLLLNYDGLKAASDIMAKVNSVLNQLPAAAQLPSINVTVGQSIASMYIGFYSEDLAINKITDYLLRVVQPKLQAVNGVQQAEILGGQQFALRAWLDPVKMSSQSLTTADVAAAMKSNNFIAAAGRTDGNMFIQNLTTTTDMRSVNEFRNMVLKSENGAIVRLKDVGEVDLGAQNYNSKVSFDGLTSVYLSITLTPSANLLDVIGEVKRIFPTIQEQLPQGLSAKIIYDASLFVDSSIDEVVKTLYEAVIIVTVVIFLFLGSFRSVLIPVTTIPLSLIGAFFMMLAMGFSINLLTLLALVLAIGLVVDDAIVVVENVQRHMEDGVSAKRAAVIGARELVLPIIATTVVLIAVYLPVGFMGGLTGSLFTEFAFTLVGAVIISTILALTLSPMMCSKIIKLPEKGSHGIMHYINLVLTKVERAYAAALHKVLNMLPVVMVFAVVILVSNVYLFGTSQSELAPQEDQGIIISMITAPANSSLEQTHLYSQQVYDIFKSYPETDHIFMVDGNGGINLAMVGMVLKPWDQRKRSTNELQPLIQKQLGGIAGAKAVVFQPPSLPGGGSGTPIQFVIKTTQDFNRLNEVTQNIVNAALDSGTFIYIDPDLKIDQQQTSLDINRDIASQLGLNMEDVGNIIASALSEGYINYFNYSGRSYQVIPQMVRSDRTRIQDLLNYYITTATGQSIKLSTIASLRSEVVPQSINHFQQLNSATISAVGLPGVTLGSGLGEFNELADKALPEGYEVDYAAQSRQFIQEGSSLMVTFVFALIVIFLSLAALYESFRDPLIVLISVPMSICGAMIFVSLGVKGVTLNIYTQVALITLIGLISKNAILIVDFANEQQLLGKSKREAAETACLIRFRPILMTTASMVFGIVPLIIATGAGALSRQNIGIVISTGLSIGTIFTLFVVPSMYVLIAEDRSKISDDSKDFAES